MARAHSIWVVKEEGVDGPIMAFTVKHELVTWLSRPGTELPRLTVYKLADNSDRVPVQQFDLPGELMPSEQCL